MSYSEAFDQVIEDVLAPCGLPCSEEFWPESLTEAGVAFGQQEALEAPEAAAWYLSAAALKRMQEGALGAPATARIVNSARRLAKARNLSPALRDALLRLDEDRRAWFLENHEFQGADLRALRPLPDRPEVYERVAQDEPSVQNADPAARVPSSVWDEDGFENAVDDYPGTDWPGLLDRLLDRLLDEDLSTAR